MKRFFSHGWRLRIFLLLIAVCTVFLITFPKDVVWLAEQGPRVPNFIPPDITANSIESGGGESLRPQKKSPKLGRELSSFGNEKDFSELQKRQKVLLCGSEWQEDYMQLHDDILNNRKPPRYLIYSCGGKKYGCGGYGNRLGAITSLFYLAVITGRAFLIDLNSTVPITDYLQPKNIRWNYPTSKLNRLKRSYHYWGKGDHEKVIKESQRSAETYDLFREWIEGTDLNKYLNSPVEVVTSLWYFASSFREYKFARPLAEKLGANARGHRFSLVGCAFDFLFERTPDFENTLSAARESLHFKADAPRIGIHIRMGDASLFPRSLDQRTTNYNSFFTCAKKLESEIVKWNGKIHRKDIKWFLATDSIEVKKYALQTYPNKVVSLSVKVEHMNVLNPSTEGMTGIFLDHTLLSESDFLVLSESSFSKTALGMNFHSLVQSTFGEKCRYKTR